MPLTKENKTHKYMIIISYTDKCDFDFTLLATQMKDLGLRPFIESNPKQAIFTCSLQELVNLKRHVFSVDGFYRNLNNKYIRVYTMRVDDISFINKNSF